MRGWIAAAWCAASLVGWCASSAPAADDEAVAAIERLGGSVEPVDRGDPGRGDLVAFWPTWSKPILTDADLAKAAVHLRRLPGLRVLMLDFTRVTDAGLEHLRGLDGLEVLTLKATGVTDAGLEPLKALPRLREVQLNLTGVTDRGAAAFREARRGVKVEASGPGEPAAEAARLRGRWRATKSEAGGGPQPGPRDETLVVAGNDLALSRGGYLLYYCRFALDADAGPRGGTCRILAALPGFNSRTEHFGFAYRAEGDALTLCLGSTDRPAERPRELSGTAGHLYVFEREKPGDAAAAGEFVTEVGTHSLHGGKLTVEVYREGGRLNYRIGRVVAGGRPGSGPPKAAIEEGSGWFVYAPTPDEVWVFDGGRSLVLRPFHDRRPGYRSGGSYEVGKDPQGILAVPEAVRDRLPAGFKERFERPGPRPEGGGGEGMETTGSAASGAGGSNMWCELHERLRRPMARERRETTAGGARFVRRPTAAALDAYGAKAGARLPASYRQFVLLFGPGRLGYAHVACPGYPAEGRPVDLEACDRGFHERWSRVGDEELARVFGDPARFRRLVNFADSDGKEWVWDPAEVIDPRAPEYAVYLIDRHPPMERVEGGFRGFVEGQLRKFTAEQVAEEVPFAPASRKRCPAPPRARRGPWRRRRGTIRRCERVARSAGRRRE